MLREGLEKHLVAGDELTDAYRLVQVNPTEDTLVGHERYDQNRVLTQALQPEPNLQAIVRVRAILPHARGARGKKHRTALADGFLRQVARRRIVWMLRRSFAETMIGHWKVLAALHT